MTRGKYAQRAADKRAELEVTTDLATYQHRVAHLTAENRDLRERLDTERAAHKKVERRLRAERDEGVAPQVEALTLSLRAAVAERDRARRSESGIRDKWAAAFTRFIDHFRDEHGMQQAECMEACLRLVGGEDRIFVDGSIQRDDLPPEAVLRIQAARGKRSGAK